MSSFLDDSDESAAMAVGQKAPDFLLDTESGEEWRLSEQLGSVVALLFYPKDETLVCTKQMCSVRDHWTDYLETKALVIGISPGSVEDHRSFSQRHRLPLPLLADVNCEITNTYGWHWLLPVRFTRAVVVVDAKGIIRHRKIMLRAFRPTDKSVLASIHAARTDNLYERYGSILKNYKVDKPFGEQ